MVVEEAAATEEVEVVRVIESCPGDVWGMRPRKHPGPRRRHDACEVVQGLTDLRAGQDFDCETWGWGGPEPSADTWRATPAAAASIARGVQ